MKIPPKLKIPVGSSGDRWRGWGRQGLSLVPISLLAVGLIAAGMPHNPAAQPLNRPAAPAAARQENDPQPMTARLAALAAAAEPTPADRTPATENDGLPPGLQRYTVQSGDNLWTIASQFGSTVDQIVASNNLQRSDLIGPGKELLIPVQPGFAYTVKSGDSIEAIAIRFGTRADAIATGNSLDSSAVLQPGQLLFLPGAKAPAASSARIASTSRSLSGSRSSGDWIWPVHGVITSPFGERWGRMHEGIDIAVRKGTPVHAARGGRVTLASWYGGYGNAIIINHGDGLSTLYGHLSEIDVKVGEQVDQGEVIGLSGSTGESTGPHVHFEIRVNNVQHNPLSYLP